MRLGCLVTFVKLECTRPAREGYVLLNDKSYQPRIRLDAVDASMAAGGAGVPGKVIIRNGDYVDQVIIDGATGDVILTNADCAEDFEVLASELVEPGTVMVLNDNGQLIQGIKPYDKRVAGVVSGARDLKPGLVLGRQSGQMDRLPIALIGQVYCKVDASYGPIAVGDLLTTSATPGYAMKASDPANAFGAVIGKALQPLATGQGLIRMMVALQ